VKQKAKSVLLGKKNCLYNFNLSPSILENMNFKYNCPGLTSVSFVCLLFLSGLPLNAQTAVIAHRGGAALAPENTLAAFRNAIDLKADWFELDVWLSRDDSLMVFHDSRLNRTSTGSGSLESLTYGELCQLDAGSWFDPAFSGERIPTLREALLLARDNSDGIGVVIEIKSNDKKVPPAIVNLVRELDMEQQVIISGFNYDQVSLARAIAPEIPVQLFGHINKKDIDRMAAIRGEWVGTGGKPDRQLLGYAHERGIRVNAWTLNTEKAIREALDLGIDGITTDQPGLALELRNESGSSGPLRIAACQFPVSGVISQNARWIKEQMREAAGRGTDLIQFPECALSGYPGVDVKTLEAYPWDSLKYHTRKIMDLARELKVWVLLGSLHPLDSTLKPLNCIYVINASGQIADRYDKRFCTLDDLELMSAGDHFVTFELKGVRCGILICFDVRFPELYRAYCRLGTDCIFQSFYNARQKPGGIHPQIMPVTAQAHAGINHFYMSLTNSSAPSSWPCYFITPDGMVADKLEPDEPGILFSEIDLTKSYYDASKILRNKALRGKLSSAASPEHARNSNRKSL